MMRWALLAALLAAALAHAQSRTEEEAGDVSEVDKDRQSPLRERVRPVTGHLLLMKGRFEVAPGVGISIKDAFFTKYQPTLALTYHFNEDFAASASVGYGISIVSGAAQICTPASSGMTAGCAAPTRDLLTSKNAFGQGGLNFGAELQWSPLYGKIAMIAEKFLHFNMYGAIGPQFLMYGPNSQFTVGGNVGVGFRWFINRWLTIRTELRDVLYLEKFGESDGQTSFRNQLMMHLGVSMFFPLTFEPG